MARGSIPGTTSPSATSGDFDGSSLMRTPGSFLVRLSWLLAAVTIAGGSIVLNLGRAQRFASADPDEIDRAGDHDRKPGSDSPDQAMQWVLLAYRDENGNIPRDGLMKAHAQAEAMR